MPYVKWVLIGLSLNTFVVNLLCLNYILPAIGMVLLLLGFRALRRVNPWFQACWGITVIRALFFFPTLILNATIWQETLYATAFASLLAYGTFVLHLLLILLLKRAFHAMQRKTGALTAFAIWYLAMFSLAMLPYVGWPLILILFLAFAFILRKLCEFYDSVKELDFTTPPVRLSDRALVGVLSSVLLIGIAVGYLCFDQYPMQWSASQPGEASKELLDLGFPESILNDLTQEDRDTCENALAVTVNQRELPLNSEDTKDIRLTSVAVKLPGEQTKWKIIHHFQWLNEPAFPGTEALEIWPAYQDNAGWLHDGPPTGQVLYDQDGITYTAPHFSAESVTHQEDSVFWGIQTSTDVFAEFSFPNGKERYRGYVAYDILEQLDDYSGVSHVNYIHQQSPFQYPVKTAKEHIMAYGFLYGTMFPVMQSSVAFGP